MWTDTEQRARTVTGVAIIIFGALWLLDNLLGNTLGEWVWIVAFAAAAGVFGWGYAQTREGWTAIAGYVMGAIAVLIFAVTQLTLPDVLIPALVLSLIGLPFVVGWWLNREQWGLLIPAYVMFAIALGLIITEPSGLDDWMPTYVLGAVGLPFMVAALIGRNWALLIPGGIMWVIALSLMPAQTTFLAQAIGVVIPLILIGWGVLLLLRRDEGEAAPAKRKHEEE